jgi:hypothetical protein
MKKFIRTLERIDGVDVLLTRHGHYRVMLDDRVVATLSGTPSDYRWRPMAVSTLKRAGIRI